ncbi:unnamed protein product [Cuscuta europaea]|uniref:Uncharacterized protein n=1 Tax=Cuscuta europaea TaxID=41803 RepID=A0A9P0ZBC8_CUSEU|nr:unnamed protein product [Cuscuta europaea]
MSSMLSEEPLRGKPSAATMAPEWSLRRKPVADLLLCLKLPNLASASHLRALSISKLLACLDQNFQRTVKEVPNCASYSTR